MLARPRDAAAAGEAAEEAAAATAASKSVDWTRDRANTGKPSAWHVRHLSGRRVAANL